MDFQEEYETLTSLNSDKILEIAFGFNNHRIKIYFAEKTEYKFLTLVCENDQISFVKNFGVYFSNDKAKINGYWGKYHNYAKGLSNSTNFGYSEFYTKLKNSIKSVNIPDTEFKISYLSNFEGIKRINNHTQNSVIPGDAIFFNHVRRKPISPQQFTKVTENLGKDVAKYLKYSNLTAVFTSDITKQKSFILLPNDEND